MYVEILLTINFSLILKYNLSNECYYRFHITDGEKEKLSMFFNFTQIVNDSFFYLSSLEIWS